MRFVTCVMFTLFIVTPAYSATAFFTANIVKIQTDAVNFGGCMAKLDVSPTSKLAACKPDWVSFACDGVHNSKDVAGRLFGAAQLALVTKTPISIRITDAKVYNNGYCVVDRIDNAPPT